MILFSLFRVIFVIGEKDFATHIMTQNGVKFINLLNNWIVEECKPLKLRIQGNSVNTSKKQRTQSVEEDASASSSMHFKTASIQNKCKLNLLNMTNLAK